MEQIHSLEAIRGRRRTRLAELLDQHGKVELSRLVDISADYLWQMGKGVGKSARGISDANARKIEQRLGKPAGWLDSMKEGDEDRRDEASFSFAHTLSSKSIEPAVIFGGDLPPEEMRQNALRYLPKPTPSRHPPAISQNETQAGYVRYQVMGEGGAGPDMLNPDHPEVLREVEIAKWQLEQELGRIPSPERVKLLTVRGNSMLPRIRSGDVVFVDIEDRRPHDGGLFVIVLHGHALVKRIEIRTDGLHIVSLATPERPDIVPPNAMDSLHIAGRVLGALQLRKSEDL